MRHLRNAALVIGTLLARQALRRLETRFTVKPVVLPGGHRGVHFLGKGSYRKLVDQILPLGEATKPARPARLMVVPPG